ncbi:hypothetical protein DENSPDRAFT_318935 [Dentipellis sp. KUC8613]|nr:hypothetical protein DENSPDRAFT_318935 [Dentipellis sp. KUC8613]
MRQSRRWSSPLRTMVKGALDAGERHAKPLESSGYPTPYKYPPCGFLGPIALTTTLPVILDGPRGLCHPFFPTVVRGIPPLSTRSPAEYNTPSSAPHRR